jgi:hypothetical protein
MPCASRKAHHIFFFGPLFCPGVYVIYIAMFTAGNLTIDYKAAQIICCFVPPLALQIGSGSFLKSYDGIPTSAICGIMVRALPSRAHFRCLFQIAPSLTPVA